jgi:ornithine cyclodeaminase
MRIITQNDLLKAAGPLDFLSAIEKAFLLQEEGDFFMPDRMHVTYNENVLLLMPAFRKQYFGTKLVSVFPGNRKKGKAVIQGSMLLNDGETGELLAMMDAATLTAFRTAAVGALGILYTTPKEADKLGLIGAGTQGFHQALFAAVVRNLKEIHFFDPYLPHPELFIRKLEKHLPEINIIAEKDAENVVKKTQVIITATTSEEPVIPETAEITGKHFIGIGSYKPTMREMPEKLFHHLQHLVIDTPHTRNESGDVYIPIKNDWIKESQILRLGQLINGTKQINVSETTFFKTAGMALFDLLAAQMVYEKAVEKNIGTLIEL